MAHWRDKQITLQIRPVTNPAWIEELIDLNRGTLFDITLDATGATIATSIDYAIKTCTFYFDQSWVRPAKRRILDRIAFIVNRYILGENAGEKIDHLRLSSPDLVRIMAQDTFDLTDQEKTNGSPSDGGGVSCEAGDTDDPGSGEEA